jgi:hypothetical protein
VAHRRRRPVPRRRYHKKDDGLLLSPHAGTAPDLTVFYVVFTVHRAT